MPMQLTRRSLLAAGAAWLRVHVGTELLGGYPLRPAYPGALTIDRGPNLLDAYTA